MEVDLGELAEDKVKEVAFIEPIDLVAKLELVQEDLTGVGGESSDEVGQVGVDLLLVGEQRDILLALGSFGRLEHEAAGVVERHARSRRLAEHEFPHLFIRLRREGFRSLQELLLGGLQHAIQAAQDRQRQNYLAVIGLPVITP